MTHTIGMISLGCAKNQVNAEQMLYLLRQAGYEILPDPDGAELVIINTCGFIDSAKEEAIDHILAMGALKQEGRVGKILVTGCLAQRYQTSNGMSKPSRNSSVPQFGHMRTGRSTPTLYFCLSTSKS